MNQQPGEAPDAKPSSDYQPPAVEAVLTADALAREVHYAGEPTVCVDNCSNDG